MITLKRRGFDLGVIDPVKYLPHQDSMENWNLGMPILARTACALGQIQSEINQSEQLYRSVLEGENCDEILSSPPYSIRLSANFECIGSSINEGEPQEIETILFDAMQNGETLAEDLWVKISWLSFYENEASLRFRFSFGTDHIEDVAADAARQEYAAALTDAIFPESRAITENQKISQKLCEILNCGTLRFVERIIYFNSPSGGAYFHHDMERGHAGVIYAQLSGSTFWLALPKFKLAQEIITFVETCELHKSWPISVDHAMQTQISGLCDNSHELAEELETFTNNALIHLINECEEFVQQLIENQHGRLLHAGDVLLLPQSSQDDCCWHTVFNLGDESGQALSFAIRAD